MSLISQNATLKVIDFGASHNGIYRVIAISAQLQLIALYPVSFDLEKENSEPPLKKKLVIVEIGLICQLKDQGNINLVKLKEGKLKAKKDLNEKESKIYYSRMNLMANFFDQSLLSEAIFIKKSIISLVNTKMLPNNSGFSKVLVYRLFNQLCQFGFTDSSLMPKFDDCGARGITRPCGELKINSDEIRKKSGRKSNKEKLVPDYVATQQGMTAVNRKLLEDLYKQIKTPHLSDRKVHRKIINNAFITEFEITKNGLKPILPPQGTFPNYRQFKHIVDSMNKVDRLKLKTTEGHFNRNFRGLTGKSWMNVNGPGHVFAIDSTIGDIFLRSSANRAWVCGRPVVYIVVDVWSTAIVGFYVCWTGPSWPMAKIALFCAVSRPKTISCLWGIEEQILLSPEPTLPHCFRCDRGEYLSLAAAQTALNSMFSMEYNPSYRPDLKGIVEVLNRIIKDEQYAFLPGAIDARRAELELKSSDPEAAMLVLKEYVEYLTLVFNNYNHTSSKVDRLDVDMIADNVEPTPAGLWTWGHEVGLGYSKTVSEEKLIQELLPQGPSIINRSGFYFSNLQYVSEQIDLSAMTAQARNFGAMESSVSYFPGSVSKIWWNHPSSGLIDFTLSPLARSKPSFSLDEWFDTLMYGKLDSQSREYESIKKKIDVDIKIDKIVSAAKVATQKAISNSEFGEFKPSNTEVKKLEKSIECNSSEISMTELVSNKSSFDPVMDDYTKMINQIMLNAPNGSDNA